MNQIIAAVLTRVRILHPVFGLTILSIFYNQGKTCPSTDLNLTAYCQPRQSAAPDITPRPSLHL